VRITSRHYILFSENERGGGNWFAFPLLPMPPFPELKEITPPTPPPLSSPEEIQRVVWLVFAAVVVVMALGVLWLWWRSRERNRRAPPLPLSAQEEARRRLAHLESLAPQLEGPALGQQVCEVIRHYLERQHGLLARYRTTEELLGAVHNLTTPPLPFLRPFAGVLRRCDDLKFAGFAFPSTERSALVRETLAALNARPPLPDQSDVTDTAQAAPVGLPDHAERFPPGPPPPPALGPNRADAFTHVADSDRGSVLPS
jgi:hypothetical protein